MPAWRNFNIMLRVQSLTALSTTDTKTLSKLHQELRKRGIMCISWFIVPPGD